MLRGVIWMTSSSGIDGLGVTMSSYCPDPCHHREHRPSLTSLPYNIPAPPPYFPQLPVGPPKVGSALDSTSLATSILSKRRVSLADSGIGILVAS